MKQMLSGAYIDSDTKLHQLSPNLKLIGFFALIIAIVAANSWSDYLLALIAILVLARIAHTPAGMLWRQLRFVFGFLVVIFLMNAFFFSGDEPLFQLWIFRLTLAGMLQGANIVLKVALLMLLSTVFLSCTSPLAITAGLKSFFKPLGRIGIPVDQVALMISIAIQFVPVLIDESALIIKAQTARGARLDSRNPLKKARASLPLIIPIFVSAIRRADELALAMEARGYKG